MKYFEATRVAKPKKNKFDLSHERKLTFNMGNLIPIMCNEVLPGDSFRVQSSLLVRMLALLAPAMHRIDVTVHYFFVPNRLIYKNWQNFITGGTDGQDISVAPYFTAPIANGFDTNYLKSSSLLDYLGFPVMKSTDTYNWGASILRYSALPLAAYQLIWREYYRDQTLQPDPFNFTFPMADATTSVGTDLFKLRKRCWEKDYFTSSLPWTQRGKAVSTPITATAVGTAGVFRDATSGTVLTPAVNSNVITAAGTSNISAMQGAAYQPAIYDPQGSLNITLSALRLSNRLQQWLEKNALGGARYIEQIAAHFGVISSDARLQRPEYLGGGKQTINISEVMQNAPISPGSGGYTPLGTMAGHGISLGASNQFSRTFEEHGFVIGIMSALPKTAYQSELHPMWSSRDANTKYYWPEFANLSEQAVQNQNVYTNMADAAAHSLATAVFGYQSRYAEYKSENDRVSGQFREGLSYWHFGRQFSAAPNLNSAFVEANVRTDPFAVVSADNLLAQVYNKIDALRPIPYFGTPRL